MIKTFKPGAVLIELLLFIAFVGVTAGVILSIIIFVSIQQKNAEVAHLVEDTGTKILTVLTQQIRQGEEIAFPEPGRSAQTLQLVMADDDKHPLLFTTSNAMLYFGTTDTLEPLFDGDILSVHGVFIENISSAESESVRIAFTLKVGNESSGIEYEQTFTSVVHLYEDNITNQDCDCELIACDGSFYTWEHCAEGTSTCLPHTSAVACSTIGLVSVSSITYPASEAGAIGEFEIELSKTHSSSLIVSYTLEGDAEEGEDYVDFTGSVTIDPGDYQSVVTLTPINDDVYEGDETVVFQVSVTSSSEFAINPDRNIATIDILDNDGGSTSTSCVADWPKCDETGIWYSNTVECNDNCPSLCKAEPCDAGGP